MSPLDFLDGPIDSMTNLKGPKAIIAFLIMAGYMIRQVPNTVLPNRLIPVINCFVVGPALSIVLLGWPGPGDIEPDVRWPEVAAWCWAYAKGTGLGLIAWLGYEVAIKRFEDLFKPKSLSPADIQKIAKETTP